jgi:hypothetical protein
VEDQDPHGRQAKGGDGGRAAGEVGYRVARLMNNPRQIYRLRAPASGREALAPIEPGAVYVDRETGEELLPVTRLLPLAPSDSALLRAPENLRICRRCDQLIGLDISDCPYCGLRQPALDGTS